MHRSTARSSLLVLLLAFATAANAADPVKIDMTAVIMGPDGKPAPDVSEQTKDDSACAKCATLTLGRAISAALLTPDRDATPGQLAARYALAMRIRDAKDATLTDAERELIKKELAKTFGSPVLLGQAYPLLDPGAKIEDVR